MKAIVIAASVGVLAAGAAGGYALLWRDPPPASTQAALAPAPPPPARSADPVFVAVDPLAMPVRRDDRVRGYYFVQISLQVADDSGREIVVRQMPRVRDAFLRDLNANPVTREGLPDSIDLELLKSRLLHQADHVLGAGIVEDVLVIRVLRNG